MTRVIEALAATAVTGFARLVTGVRGNWRDCAPDPRPRVYFANHNSHGDFVLIWTVLPPALRRLHAAGRRRRLLERQRRCAAFSASACFAPC